MKCFAGPSKATSQSRVSIIPQIPKPLEAICLKAMALAPAERYATCQALADDVERFLADEPVTALREPSRPASRDSPVNTAASSEPRGSPRLDRCHRHGAAFLINEQRNRAEQLAEEKSDWLPKKNRLA